jgi:hypothetical protein
LCNRFLTRKSSGGHQAKRRKEEKKKRRKEIYPRARFAKDESMLTIWPKDTHRRGLGDD